MASPRQHDLLIDTRTVADDAPGGALPPAMRAAVYDVIRLRRDVRSFRPDPVDDALLRRLLEAAHHAGSVGNMQPWDFIVVRSAAQKARVHALFRDANARAVTRYADDRATAYLSLKLQGILDAPLGLCVTCDTTRGGPHVLGRDSAPEMDRYSTCLAVQNLWLAARAEGIGVGWVSIVDHAALGGVLGLPAGVVPVAYLCVGHPVEFAPRPMLAEVGWRARLPLAALVHEDRWGARSAEGEAALRARDPVTAAPWREGGAADEQAEAEKGHGASATSGGHVDDSAGDRAGAAADERADAVVHGDPSADAASPTIGADAVAPSGDKKADAGSIRASTRSPSLDVPDDRLVAELHASIRPADPDGTRTARLQARLDALAKPTGSLGRLEALGVRLAAAQALDWPRTERKRVVVFAADHGVARATNVSAYRPDVTAQLCYTMMAGGCTLNALLRPWGGRPELVDVGVDHDFGAADGLVHAKVRRGTRNLADEAALTPDEVLAALREGARSVLEAPRADVLVLGEIGIGNSTAAAALAALGLDLAPEDATGRGTGVQGAAAARKRAVVARAVARARTEGLAGAAGDPLGQLAAVGGLEIAALVGAILASAAQRTPVLLDGFIVGTAALLAVRLAPATCDYLVAGHVSSEPAHAAVLRELALDPLLSLDLRLGEASGAALALPLLDAACAVLRDVRTFEEAGIDAPLDPRALA